MYTKHKHFRTPSNSTTIWHYFSLAKFIGLLDSSSLYFSRQDQFDDVKEGRLSQADKNYLNCFHGSIAEHMESDKNGCFYANCWTVSESDEYVLWSTYASLKNGIAVKSTIGKLIDALDEKDERQVYIAKVEYYNEVNGSSFKVSDGIINLLALGFSKREYFVAENELRLLYRSFDAHLDKNSPTHISFSVDLTKLIDSIYVSPKSYPWFRNAISKLIELYGLRGIPVYESSI